MTLHAGKLNKRVTVQSIASIAENAVGDRVATWQTHAIRWANVIPDAKPRSETELGWTVQMRYDDLTKAINHTMRIIYGSRTLNIINPVDVKDRNEEIRIGCIESTQVSVS